MTKTVKMLSPFGHLRQPCDTCMRPLLLQPSKLPALLNVMRHALRCQQGHVELCLSECSQTRKNSFLETNVVFQQASPHLVPFAS